MAIRRSKKPSLVLPLSSMGDIAFLLIIFFMLASNFMKNARVEHEQPLSPDLEQQDAAQRSIILDKDARIWYEGVETTTAEIVEQLRPLAEKDHGFAVHVAIDKNLKRDQYMPLIESVSESGVKLVLTGEQEQ